MSQTRFGITFSHPHFQHLGISVDEALEYAFSLGFSQLRIGIYWNRIERKKDNFDFSEVEMILEKCERKGQKVILNIGMKSPRWPEFYLPTYLDDVDLGDNEVRERVLLFIKATIAKFKQYNCITHWQVENEPLDPSGKDNRAIPLTTLKDEVKLVRSLDKRPIIISLWGNDIKKRTLLPLVEPLADVVGIDLYYKQYRGELFGKSMYSGPQTSDQYLSKLIQNSSKPVIITELQAEPWEKDEKRYLSESQKSISPELLRNNIRRAINLGANEILLWGYEYWYYQMKRNNYTYINTLKEFDYHTPSVVELGAAQGGR